jgi:hypothetical protein
MLNFNKMKLIVKDKIKLSELEAGKLFMTVDMKCLALKSEYRTAKGAIESHIVGSGEMFWGGTSDIRVLNNLDVFEVEVVNDSTDIYTGKLNTERIKKYQKLAEDFTIEEGTVRDIFCKGAEWGIEVSEKIKSQ